MIERTNAFKVGDQCFNTLGEAQIAELKSLLETTQPLSGMNDTNNLAFAGWVINNKDKIMDILTTTSTSNVKARKINGGTKARKPKQASSSHIYTPQVDVMVTQ